MQVHAPHRPPLFALTCHPPSKILICPLNGGERFLCTGCILSMMKGKGRGTHGSADRGPSALGTVRMPRCWRWAPYGSTGDWRRGGKAGRCSRAGLPPGPPEQSRGRILVGSQLIFGRAGSQPQGHCTVRRTQRTQRPSLLCLLILSQPPGVPCCYEHCGWTQVLLLHTDILPRV